MFRVRLSQSDPATSHVETAIWQHNGNGETAYCSRLAASEHRYCPHIGRLLSVISAVRYSWMAAGTNVHLKCSVSHLNGILRERGGISRTPSSAPSLFVAPSTNRGIATKLLEVAGTTVWAVEQPSSVFPEEESRLSGRGLALTETPPGWAGAKNKYRLQIQMGWQHIKSELGTAKVVQVLTLPYFFSTDLH